MKLVRWIFTLPLRLRTLFLRKQLEQELGEELQFHLEQEIEQLVATGLSLEDAHNIARRGLYSLERQKERCRDVRAWHRLDVLRADIVFGWGQLMKNKVTSGAAVLSLALAIGACTAAFRLIDAMLLRSLPISDPARLYAIRLDGFTFQGKPYAWDTVSYPVFQKMRAAVKQQAELIAIGYAQRSDLTYASDQEMEKAQLQYVSGWMFSSFGLASVRYVQTLLFGVKGSDPALLALPALALVVTTLLAALPAVARAAAIDPAIMLRAE